MKWVMNLFMILTFASLALFARVLAQPRFEVPITVTEGTTTQIMHFGFLPGGHYCIDPADSINGYHEDQLPPMPPAGVFDTRFVFPHISATECYDQGSLCDFRPFVSATQRDTFKVKAQFGVGSAMVFSWPAGLSSRFTQLTLRFFDGSANVNIDMLTDTVANITDAGDPATISIFSGGLVITAVEPASAAIPGEFALFQNYPNPFNPSTSIGFSLPAGQAEIRESGFVSLKVFDVLGREVATVVNERMMPGTYERPFNADGLTSGVYFYRLQANGFAQTKKFLLLR